METLAAKEYGYLLLAIAITKQAAKDYQIAYQDASADDYAHAEMEELEEWFRSRRGSTISLGMGETIMERIRNGELVINDEED